MISSSNHKLRPLVFMALKPEGKTSEKPADLKGVKYSPEMMNCTGGEEHRPYASLFVLKPTGLSVDGCVKKIVHSISKRRDSAGMEVRCK